MEAVTAIAGQGLHASKQYLTLTHTPDRLGVLGWVDAADSAWGCGACLRTDLLTGSACCLVNCNKRNSAICVLFLSIKIVQLNIQEPLHVGNSHARLLANSKCIRDVGAVKPLV